MVYSDVYEWTKLSEHGPYMTIDDVPKFADGTFCDFCTMTIEGHSTNPCTMFDTGPVSAYDCAANFCPEYDYCSTILESLPLESNEYVTDRTW